MLCLPDGPIQRGSDKGEDNEMVVVGDIIFDKPSLLLLDGFPDPDERLAIIPEGTGSRFSILNR